MTRAGLQPLRTHVRTRAAVKSGAWFAFVEQVPWWWEGLVLLLAVLLIHVHAGDQCRPRDIGVLEASRSQTSWQSAVPMVHATLASAGPCLS